jgi:hypothetical protein
MKKERGTFHLGSIHRSDISTEIWMHREVFSLHSRIFFVKFRKLPSAITYKDIVGNKHKNCVTALQKFKGQLGIEDRHSITSAIQESYPRPMKNFQYSGLKFITRLIFFPL